MPVTPALYSFSASTTIRSSEVNSNFTNLRDTVNTYAVLTDVAKTITVTHTYSASQTFTGGFTAGATCTVSTGNVAITAGNLTFGAASAKIIPGATSLLVRDTADANTNLGITDAGAVTIRAGLTVSGSGITVTGNSTITGTLAGITTLSADVYGSANASPKLLTGATSLVVRNSTDAATLLTISNGGAIMQGSSMAFSFGGGTVGTVNASSANLQCAASGGFVTFSGGALATNATLGFATFPSCAGTPTGVPNSPPSGAIPFVYDSTNNYLYVYNGGAWKKTAVFA